MGVADHCKEYYYDVVLNGKIVERRGFACLMKGKDYESSRWYIIADPTSSNPLWYYWKAGNHPLVIVR